MPGTYIPGETNTIYLQVLRLSGSAPVFPADYTTPQLRIVHALGNVLVTDVAPTPMSQLDGNLWSYHYQVPAAPYVGNYLVEFNVAIDGIPTEVTDEFRVELADILEEGAGSCQVDGIVKDEGTLQPIPGVTVLIFAPSDLANAIAKDTTDSNGKFTVFLNPGTYRIRYHRVGFIDETHDLIVNPNCTHLIVGD